LLRVVGSTEEGLAPAEDEARLRIHGENRIRPAHRGPLREALVSQLRNPLLWLLLAAAITGIAVGETVNAGMVLAIMLLGSLLTMLQESRAGRVLERLRERIALRARVVRGSVELEIPATSIVPGDVIVLTAGTMVPADAVVLVARDLYLSEAALTGEPFAVEKQPGQVDHTAPLGARSNMVHMGTSVRSGTGRAVVVQTGAGTAFGHLAGRLALRSPETEFQRGLRRFGYLLLTMMIVLVFVVFGASALRNHPGTESLLFAVALAVGLAPEMLPAVLATMLSRGARRMAARGVLVRRLEAIENLGNMDVLCTDKTGTLTEGDIRLESALDTAGRPCDRALALGYWNAKLQAGLPNPLDRAVVEAAAERVGTLPRKLDEVPFDFTRKRLSVLVADEAPLLVTKGAFEAVLSVCTSVRDEHGTTTLDASTREQLRAMVTSWSAEGIRVIAVATRAMACDEPLHPEAERELVLEGFLTFRDPPKAGVERTIAELRELGVRVKVVSGDHHAVVQHLAATIGLPSQEVVTGAQLATLRDEALWHLVERVDLFAEVDPGQKERILVALGKMGHVVGFMGDGINDAPAMHAADVGISVQGATDVAREAADFVLLERDLGTLRAGIEEGRVTFANTLKYVLTTESANLGNMISMAAAALFLPFLPLLAHQVLLNNLLSDVPSATLSADRVDPERVRTPQHWDIAFIRRFMIAFGLISAAFDAVTFAVLWTLFDASPEQFRTAWFIESLLTELLVLLVLRTRRPLWRSRPHAALVGSTIVVAILAVLLPLSPLRGPLGFVPLPATLWIVIVGIAVTYAATVEAVKRPLFAYLDRAAARQRSKPRRLAPGHHVWPR
jgi:Mg2+-importing ATPase